jgi:hypothetical protein
MKNSRPVSSDSRPSRPFMMDQQRQSSPPNNSEGELEGEAPAHHHRQECMVCSGPWDTDSCIPIQRKSSHSLRSFLPGFDDVPGLGPLDSDNSLNDSSTSTLEGLSSILATCSSTSWPRRKHQKQLRWGKVEMRFYPVMPGDHPDTAQGPPVSPPLILCPSMGGCMAPAPCSVSNMTRPSSSQLPGTTLLPFRWTSTPMNRQRPDRAGMVISCVSLG